MNTELSVQTVIKTVTEYKQLVDVLSPLVEKYFNENYAEGWRYYRGWDLSSDGKSIIMHYSYNEWLSNTETYLETDCITESLDLILGYKYK